MSAEVKRIKEKYENYLMKLEGVTGVGYNGSINIYVERLTSKLAAFLPKQLDGVTIRVVETGKIVPLVSQPIPVADAIYADRTGRFRPAPGGISCGHPQVTAGTLSCRAIEEASGRVLGLSNNHVIALRWGTDQIGQKGDSVLQPGPADDGIDPLDKLGELERWIPVELGQDNLIDAAVFTSVELKKEVYEIGEIESPIIAQPGMNLVKSGRTTGVTYSTVFDVNASVSVEGAGTCVFKDQIIAQPAFLSPGDSGSWVGHADSYRTIGLGFAGSPSTSVICKGHHVEDLLGIVIVPPSPAYMSPTLLLTAYGVVIGTVQTIATLKRRG